MQAIDYKKIKDDLEKSNMLEIQKDLTQKRQTRTGIMSILMASLVLTLIYGLLETPFIYTLSNIGNLFPNRLFFIVWSIITGVSIQYTVIILFRNEVYKSKSGYTFIGLSALFLIITALVPADVEEFPFLWAVHTGTAALHALFFLLAVFPYSRWVSNENPRLRKIISIWQIIIYGGSISMLLIFRRGGMFEIWFYVSNIIYLLYLTLVLFEEAIIKRAVELMDRDENLNVAIEKYFVDLEEKSAKQIADEQKESERKQSKKTA